MCSEYEDTTILEAHRAPSQLFLCNLWVPLSGGQAVMLAKYRLKSYESIALGSFRECKKRELSCSLLANEFSVRSKPTEEYVGKHEGN